MRASSLERPLAQHQGELQAEQLVEHQAAAGGARRRSDSGRVDGPKASVAVRRGRAVGSTSGRERVGELAGALRRALDPNSPISHVVSPALADGG